MFFRSMLSAVMKANVISIQSKDNACSAVETTAKPAPSSSSSGVVSYIAIVLIATLIVSIIAIRGDDVSAHKNTELRQSVAM